MQDNCLNPGDMDGLKRGILALHRRQGVTNRVDSTDNTLTWML